MALKQITQAEWEAEVTQSETRVLVDFYAQWCAPCRALAPLLERFSGEKGDALKIVKVDTDQDEELAARYGVRTIPTLIAFDKGEEVARAVNPQSRAKLEELAG